jgi:hypothetical protein
MTWAANQPDNRAGIDDCLHMRLFKDKKGIEFWDRNCSDKFVVACEVFEINIIKLGPINKNLLRVFHKLPTVLRQQPAPMLTYGEMYS